MKLKDNFVQAAKELMGTPEEAEKKEKDKAPAQPDPQEQGKHDERVSALQSPAGAERGSQPPRRTARRGLPGTSETNARELHGTFTGILSAESSSCRPPGRHASGSSLCRRCAEGHINAQKDVPHRRHKHGDRQRQCDSSVSQRKVKGD